jgi:hypothetical protein
VRQYPLTSQAEDAAEKDTGGHQKGVVATPSGRVGPGSGR